MSNATTGTAALDPPGPRTSARTVVAWIVAAQAVLLVVSLSCFWVRVFYFGDVDVLAILSSNRSDMPPVRVVPWQLGVHIFGDFIFPYAQAIVPNPWTDYTPAPTSTSYPPALMLIFKLFTLLRYKVALTIYLALNIACMTMPVAIAARRLTVERALVTLCLLVFLSFPFLMVVDRGNVQGLLIVPLYLFAVAWRNGRWRWVAIAISVLAALKLYPALLVMVLLAERRFREAVLSLAAAAAATLLLFACFPGGFNATMRGFLAALVPFAVPTPDRIIVSNYSVLGMLANFCAALFGVASPQVAWLLGHPSLFGVVYLAAAAAVVFARKLPFVIRLACALSVLTFPLALSYGYTLSFIVIIVAELVRAAVRDEPGLPRPLAIALAVAVTASLALWPFPLPMGTSVGTILVPAAWVALLVTALCYGYAPARRFAPARV